MHAFSLMCCVNRPEVARRHVLASPCLAPGQGHQLMMASAMGSAGEGFAWGARLARHRWLVLLHQDVFLPTGWDAQFATALAQAVAADPTLAVAGVYGVRADGVHAGRVYDRDRWLGEVPADAVPVRSLDELLLAVRLDSGVAPDPALGWHLYGTDVCLQARAKGLGAAVLGAPCEHHSALPRDVTALDAAGQRALQPVVDAFNASAQVLCQRWPDQMPVVTAVDRIDHGYALVLPGGT